MEAFASPIATVIAAFAAIIVTWRFSVAQLAIAQSQRDIALDKLKLDFFPQRRQTYQTAKSLLEYVSLQPLSFLLRCMSLLVALRYGSRLGA
jgi:hypothetical protein